ncbi:hypothetical protein DB354_00045 [Opitutus sp. ER46]|nr:hypothetical protein DB354_00045 [Opitutus sp. ER46]
MSQTSTGLSGIAGCADSLVADDATGSGLLGVVAQPDTTVIAIRSRRIRFKLLVPLWIIGG